MSVKVMILFYVWMENDGLSTEFGLFTGQLCQEGIGTEKPRIDRYICLLWISQVVGQLRVSNLPCNIHFYVEGEGSKTRYPVTDVWTFQDRRR